MLVAQKGCVAHTGWRGCPAPCVPPSCPPPLNPRFPQPSPEAHLQQSERQTAAGAAATHICARGELHGCARGERPLRLRRCEGLGVGGGCRVLPALGFTHSPPSTAWQEVEQQLDGGQRGESARGPVQYVEKTPNPRLKREWGARVGREGGGAGSGGARGRNVPSWGRGAVLGGSHGLCWRAKASGTSGVSALGQVGGWAQHCAVGFGCGFNAIGPASAMGFCSPLPRAHRTEAQRGCKGSQSEGLGDPKPFPGAGSWGRVGVRGCFSQW